tara:strand:- start:240 stop:572 length:333 start_codon:yes stop_codon:yes gene_type:complete
MSEPVYGTLKKKVVFYDSDKRYADLKVRLEHDGLSQSKFFRGILTGYLSQDPDILNYIDKLKASLKINKKRIKEDRKLVNEGDEALSKLSLNEDEIENIFDILEKQETSI